MKTVTSKYDEIFTYPQRTPIKEVRKPIRGAHMIFETRTLPLCNPVPVCVSFCAPRTASCAPKRNLRAERGFTLIELLTVIVLLGVLAALSLQGFVLYKASAAFAVATSTLRDAQTALYAAQTSPNATFSSVDTSQRSQGALATAEGREIFPGFLLAKSLDFAYAYDPTCVDDSCPFQARVEVRHLSGQKYLRWIRFGDGVEAKLEVPGAGYGP